MENEILNQLLINSGASIKEAMRSMDLAGWGIAFLVDNSGKFTGVITNGDIRRGILKGLSIEKPIVLVLNAKSLFINEETAEKDLENLRNRPDIKDKFPADGSLKVPVLDREGRVKDIVFLCENGKSKRLLSKEAPIEKGIKKVLVIGGAGYLGSVLCRKLLDAGYKVKALDNLTFGDSGIKDLIEDQKFEFQKGDIRNISDVVEGIKGADAVIHLAAIVGDPACAADPEETLEINYLATRNIVNACKYFQVNRFIFASTCSVYGKSLIPDEKLNEESALNPVSLYAETKIKCERAILEAMDENFSPAILRMATLYGLSPNMRFDLAVNIMAAKALFDKEVTVFGGDQWRPWLHLEDASSGYLACLENPLALVRGKTFNILSENYKIQDVGKIINSVFPEASLKMSAEAADLRNYNVSFDKISRTLGFVPKIKIADGVREIKEAVQIGKIKTYKDAKYRVLIS